MQSVISKREVPSDLRGVSGIRTGFHPPDEQYQRLVITGQPGAGKSTFLNSNPHLIMLDAERGGDTVADPKALRFTPPPFTSLGVLDRAYEEFVDRITQRKLQGKTDIQMVGIDSLDEMIQIFQKALCLRENKESIGDVGGGHGKGYFMVLDSVFGMLDKLHRAGLGWAVVCHSKTKTVGVGDAAREVTVLAISDSYKTAVWRKCEHMLFVERGIVTTVGEPMIVTVAGKKLERMGDRITTKVRKLKTSPGGLWKGGDAEDIKVRVPLSEELLLPEYSGWDVLAADYRRACETLTRGEGK